MKRVHYFTPCYGNGGIDSQGRRWRPGSFWEIQRKRGYVMSCVNRQRVPIRREQ